MVSMPLQHRLGQYIIIMIIIIIIIIIKTHFLQSYKKTYTQETHETKQTLIIHTSYTQERIMDGL